MTIVTSAEAQKNFGRYREQALAEPVVVTQYGKPSVVIISATEYERLKERDRRVMRLDKRNWAKLRELRARREQRDTIDAQVRGLENELKAAMGDAETAISPHDEPVIHWRTSATARMDMERFRAEQPAMYERYVVRGTTRRFNANPANTPPARAYWQGRKRAQKK